MSVKDRKGRVDPTLQVERVLDELQRLDERLGALIAEAQQAVRDQLQRAPEAARAIMEELAAILPTAEIDVETARRAARAAAADLVWKAHLGGELWTSLGVAKHLGVSRQRVSERVRKGTLIALRAEDGRLSYPAWQFRGADGGILDSLVKAHSIVAETGSDWSAASWCVAEHPELEGVSPATWTAEHRDDARLLLVAQRDAGAAAH
jgi:hypothetical protein